MARKSHLAIFRQQGTQLNTPSVSAGLPFPDPPSPGCESAVSTFTSPALRAPEGTAPPGQPGCLPYRRSCKRPFSLPLWSLSRPSRSLAPLYLLSLAHQAQGQEFPPSSLSKPSQSDPACFAHPPYKNMAALRAPPQSRHAPGNRPDLTAGQEDGGTKRGATDLGTIFGFTKGSIAGAVFLASRRTGSAGLSRSHCGLAHSSRPPTHCCLPPGAGTHAQSGS